MPLLTLSSPYIFYELTKDDRLQKKLNKLSIGTSKESVIEKLGQPELSRKSIESDYEILFYRLHNVFGLRGGKIEWHTTSYGLYQQLVEFEEGKKLTEDNE